MNDYRITFQNTETDSRETVTVTARNESEAQRTFRKAHKGDSYVGDVWNVELHRENVNATKAQEREALEKIKAMVEELGPQSYLATAFAGCFQDAEDNINDDAAYSYKDRYELGLKTQESMSGTIQELQRKVEQMQQTIDRLQHENEELEAKADRVDYETAKKCLDISDMRELAKLVEEKREELSEDVRNAETRIVESADEPASAAFQNAVKDHRAAKAELDRYTNLITRMAAKMEAAGA